MTAVQKTLGPEIQLHAYLNRPPIVLQRRSWFWSCWRAGGASQSGAARRTGEPRQLQSRHPGLQPPPLPMLHLRLRMLMPQGAAGGCGSTCREERSPPGHVYTWQRRPGQGEPGAVGHHPLLVVFLRCSVRNAPEGLFKSLRTLDWNRAYWKEAGGFWVDILNIRELNYSKYIGRPGSWIRTERESSHSGFWIWLWGWR